MWTVNQSVSFDRPARQWVWRDGRLVGAVNVGELRAYVFPLYTPRGRLVIQESPVDHPHHQGLTVGAQLNGWDMWNAGSFGIPRSRQVVVSAESHATADATGARFLLTLDWTTAGGVKMLREKRTIGFSAAAYGHVVDVRTTMIAAYGDLHFAQTKEAGLSLRVPPEWETANGGILLDARGRVGESQIFDQLAEWIDVSGEGPVGVWAGITMMPHRDSPAVPWMVRDYGLQNYDPWRHQRISLAAGEMLTLGVRYIAHDGRGTVGDIAAWYNDCP